MAKEGRNQQQGKRGKKEKEKGRKGKKKVKWGKEKGKKITLENKGERTIRRK